jgi:hypothetical protein
MIEFACPHCGHAIKIQEQFAGRRGKCAGCGKPIMVPQPATVSAASSFDVPPAATPPPEAFDDLLAEVANSSAAAAGPPPISATSAPVLAPNAPKNVQGCPDCSGLVSMRAATCPHCGCPLNQNSPVAVGPPWPEAEFHRSIGSLIVGAIGILGVLYFVLVFDTTVGNEHTGGRTHNIGLLNDRLAGITLFALLAFQTFFPRSMTFRCTTPPAYSKGMMVFAVAAVVIFGLIFLALMRG